ncbi:phospholipase D family protein [Actinomadura rupiterrae]|uniref:phospholipase D family protein n=1 Tax=Actinomadura rupiterrae TaxID=559627 RepID=UPI0020A2F82C|nr:phospholipase D family protein [Actinomadura rupiterrae]MCP2341374.1 phosphatidylserine/phosphatidylglycerophosphate/cardiolipin synthase-like enzyme [Actinomadura rupiterrae]
MADINALMKKYFVQPEDTVPPSQPLPATFGGCKITPLIDGTAYFDELKKQLAKLGAGTPAENADQFIYIAGWDLHLVGGKILPAPGSSGAYTPLVELAKPFSLDGPALPAQLNDLLKDKARAGVDVRILGWASFALMSDNFAQSKGVDHGLANTRNINLATLNAILDLRNEPKLAEKAWVNILTHSAGSAHTKLVVLGSSSGAIGFTGGLDFVGDRHGSAPHPAGQWHDVQAKVEGPAVQAMFDFFRAMWNEVRGRKVRPFRVGFAGLDSHTPGSPELAARTLPTTSQGKHHVQSLRTLPQFNYKSTNRLPENDKISFAPSGMFEISTAWFKAIKAAENFIYIEDQSFWSIDLMKALRDAIQTKPALRVILVVGVADPNDPKFPPYGLVALSQGLVKGTTPAQLGQFAMFSRDVIVHTKSTIVDDHWAIIGSANFMRRSLYTDIEHSVSVVDEDDTLVQQYRVQLWSDAFDLAPADQPKIADIGKALNVWNASWGTPGSGVTLPSRVKPVVLPPDNKTLKPNEQQSYDMLADVDSRDDWGACSL